MYCTWSSRWNVANRRCKAASLWDSVNDSVTAPSACCRLDFTTYVGMKCFWVDDAREWNAWLVMRQWFRDRWWIWKISDTCQNHDRRTEFVVPMANVFHWILFTANTVRVQFQLFKKCKSLGSFTYRRQSFRSVWTYRHSVCTKCWRSSNDQSFLLVHSKMSDFVCRTISIAFLLLIALGSNRYSTSCLCCNLDSGFLSQSTSSQCLFLLCHITCFWR